MGALYKKEILGFLSAITGWIVIGIFLTVTGLFLWVFPSGVNVLDNGYANLNGLFSLAPFVFLFLVPAVTMNSISEEKRNGTLELLLIRPLSDTKIILAKYFAAFTLVVLSLLPTLIYYYSVFRLGFPVGDIDSGGFWGSFTGLLFLGSAFTAMGLFSSSLTNNPIVSFLMAVVISAFVYMGFAFIASFFGGAELLINALGIQAHYSSMSRGVIDSRDVLYFLSLDILFLFLSVNLLGRRKWK